jgi:pimeloyl-ACP methyl ester carboxylesterase
MASKCIFAEATLKGAPAVVQHYQEISARFPTTSDVLIRQWEALKDHDTWDDLHDIKMPTLVLTGKEDVLIPPAPLLFLVDISAFLFKNPNNTLKGNLEK